MRIPYLVRHPIFWFLYTFVACRRRPDQIIGQGGPYMLRWWLFGTSRKRDDHGDPKPRRPFGLSFYLHCFVRSDDDRALHDHPWDFASLILFGDYNEHRKGDPAIYLHGDYDNCDWRGANNIRVIDDRKHYDDEVTVVRQYLAGYVNTGRAEGLHRVALSPQHGGNGPGVRAFGRAHAAQMVDLPWMTDGESWDIFELWQKEQPCWTLFVAGRWKRRWGFMCPDGWRHWREFDQAGGCGPVSEPEHAS
jgi:hypothetical protein